MDAPAATVTNSITTIPETSAPAPEAAAETPPPAETTGDSPSTAASATEGQRPESKLDLARRLEAAAKKEARSRRLESELQAKIAETDAFRKKHEAELQAMRAELEAALSDPVKYYLDKGKDPVEVARRFAKPETEEEKRIRLLEERISKRETEEQRRLEAEEKRQAAMREHHAMRTFVSAITPDECPNLTSLYEAGEVPKLVTGLLSRPSVPGNPNAPTLLDAFRHENGRNPTDAEIRECLEYEAELRATRILEAHKQRESAQVAAASLTEDPAVAGPKGISNQHAATTSSSRPRPRTLEERRRKAREELTAALEAEVAADRD